MAMGRGPGKWQRLILEALDKSEVVPISRMAVIENGGSLLPEEYSALNRAAHTLARKGVVGLVRCFGTDCRGQENVQLLAVRADSIPNETVSTHRSRSVTGGIRAIARAMGVSKSTVQRSLKE